MARIDEAVRNILRLKFALGLLEDPYRYCDADREKRLSGAPAHLEAAYEMACRSMVLIKNDDQTLPLKPGANLAVIGTLAESRRDLLGSWQAAGKWDSIETVLTGIKRKAKSGAVRFAKGFDVDSDDRSGFPEAVQVAIGADVVVMVLGESWDMTGEAASRTSIRLPGVQTELLKAIAKLGLKPGTKTATITGKSVLQYAVRSGWRVHSD
jgi:beta-glucosidase